MTFRPPSHTQTPNELFALLPQMGEAELKVTLVIIRDTFGWQAGGAATVRSLTELQKLAGLSRQGVLNGLDAGQTRGTLYKIGGTGGKAAYGLVVNEVDRLGELTGQPSRPELVNEVDRGGQRSRPQLVNGVDQTGQPGRPALVNEVDRSAPDGAAPSAAKQAPERQLKEKERKERQTTAGLTAPEAAVAAAVQEQGTHQDTAPGAGRAGTPGGVEAASADSVTGSAPSPASAEPTETTGTEQVPGAALAALTGALAPLRPLDLIAEYDARGAWLELSPARIRELHNDMRDRHGRKYRGELIEALDAEVRKSRTPEKPGTASVNDLVRSRLQGARP